MFRKSDHFELEICVKARGGRAARCMGSVPVADLLASEARQPRTRGGARGHVSSAYGDPTLCLFPGDRWRESCGRVNNSLKQGEFLLTRPQGPGRVGVMREAFLQALLPGALGTRAAVLSCQQRALGKEDLGKVRRMRFPGVRLKKVERLFKIRSTARKGPLCSRRQCARGTFRSEL